jgi:glutamate-1-semialdehyde 2,1-aminomutase
MGKRRHHFTFDKSMKLYREALRVLPAGVSSNARLWLKLCPTYVPCSIFIRKGIGSHVWDVDGNEYIDYRLGFGPVILGHGYSAVVKKVHAEENKGAVYAFDNELEIEVAKKVRSMVPCAQMIRYSLTGTEATMHAIRIARAYTRREIILKFEGHYHGAHDSLLFSTDQPQDSPVGIPYPNSLGIPMGVSKLIRVLPWNNFDAVERTMKEVGDEIAAIITEPVMGNASVIPPKPGYLQFLKEVCDEHGSVLIFDEVKTGFRLARGGAQEKFGVVPHMATFAKSLGNGYPISIIAGLQEIMRMVGPQMVVHGGTYAGNPVSLTAAEATLTELKKEKVFSHLERYGNDLMKGLRELFEEHKIDAIVQGYPEMFQFLITSLDEVSNFRDLDKVNFDLYARIHFELLSRGVMIDEDNGEPMFTCYSHNGADLKKTLKAFNEAISAARGRKLPARTKDRYRTSS